MTTASDTPPTTWNPPEPALSVRQVLTLERVLAGEPEVVAGAGTDPGSAGRPPPA
ncbi:hypothetical protein [Streptomyces sp. NPDC002545]